MILVGVPVLGPENRNEAARFVALIDALYEHKVKLLAAADAEPDGAVPERATGASNSSGRSAGWRKCGRRSIWR